MIKVERAFNWVINTSPIKYIFAVLLIFFIKNTVANRAPATFYI